MPEMMTEVVEKPINLADIRNCVAQELAQVEALLQAQESTIPLTQEISAHVTRAGGKRLRPMVLLLCAKQLGPVDERHIKLATVLELVHTATLLHDDVVDNSPLRRGQHTAMQIWGNAASVLVGDYLYSRGFRLLAACESSKATSLVADATNILAEGEILQLTHRHDLRLSEEQHLLILACKTGKLFELAAELPTIICNASEATRHALRDYGMNLGIGFQIIDDVLDYQGDADQIGKRVGDDLADGNLTLPLIHALKVGNPEQQKIITDVMLQGGTENLALIQAVLMETGALDYARDVAETYVAKALHALNGLSDTDYLDSLKNLATFSVNRSH